MENKEKICTKNLSAWYVAGMVIATILMFANLIEIIDAKIITLVLHPNNETRPLELFLIPTSRIDIFITLIYCLVIIRKKW